MILTHGSNSISRGDDDFVKIGGRSYPVVKIGNQLWLAENLDYKFSYNGSILPIGSGGYPSTPAAWYYNNNEASYGIDGTYKCGLLYNWFAVKYLDDNKSTLLPNGWRVPSNTEWDSLVNEIGGATKGTKLKAINNSVTSNWPSNWNGTDDYGFRVLPAGYYAGSFNGLGSITVFWTITESGGKGIERYFDKTSTTGSAAEYKTLGLSLRLIKDVT